MRFHRDHIAALRRRAYRAARAVQNARIVTDPQGFTLRVTRANRILAVRDEMTGQWRAPTRWDGKQRGGNIYADGALSPAVGA